MSGAYFTGTPVSEAHFTAATPGILGGGASLEDPRELTPPGGSQILFHLPDLLAVVRLTHLSSNQYGKLKLSF